MSKSVLSDAASDQKRSFTFQVQLYADDTYAEGHELKLSGRYGAMVFDENGAAEVNLTGGDSATAEGLPAGVHYRITEASADGFDLKSITTTVGNNEPSTADSNALNARAAQGTTASDDTKVEFANKRKLGFMGIMKTLDSSAASDQNKVFVFTVRLSDQSVTKDYEPVVKNDPDHVGISFVNGEATVRLTKGQRASADSLPTGLGYTVAEEDAADYNDEMSVTRAMQPVTPKGTMSETEMVNAFSTSCRANNVRRVGGLVVSKRLFNARPEDYDQEFDFKVTVNGLNTADSNALKHAITYYDT